MSGCVDLCSDVLASVLSVCDENLASKNKSRLGEGFEECFNHGAKESKVFI